MFVYFIVHIFSRSDEKEFHLWRVNFLSFTRAWPAKNRRQRDYLTSLPGAINANRIARNVDNVRAPFTNVNSNDGERETPFQQTRLGILCSSGVECRRGSSLVMPR